VDDTLGIRIDPPYGVDNCGGDDKQALERIRLLVCSLLFSKLLPLFIILNNNNNNNNNNRYQRSLKRSIAAVVHQQQQLKIKPAIYIFLQLKE
jgi:hypothetical protein